MPNSAQLKLLSSFFANLAVVWLAAALVTPVNLLTAMRSLFNGITALLFGVLLLKEVKE